MPFHEGWIQLKPNYVETQSFLPTVEGTMVNYKDSLYSFGGCSKHLTGFNYYNHMYQYNILSNKWEVIEQKGNIPSPRSSHTSVVYNDCMFVYGGTDSTTSFEEFLCFDFTKMEWLELDVSVVTHPMGRYGHSSVLYGDYWIIFAGYLGITGCTNELWSFSFKEMKWTQMEPKSQYLPPKCVHAPIVLVDHFLYVYGGYFETLYLDNLSRFNLLTQMWEQVKYSGNGPSKVSPSELTPLRYLIIL
jgi:N-acetylneuraminic acid mutarotase